MARNTQEQEQEQAQEPVTDPTAVAVEAPSVPEFQPGDIVGESIQRADSLIAVRKQVQEDLQVSREFLNGVAKQGLGTDEQRAWINYHLPRRTRKSKTAESNGTAE